MVYHIIEQSAWEAAQEAGSYAPASLSAEGFIHFSKLHQVLGVVGRFYANVPNLMLLLVDEEKLAQPLVYEKATDVDDTFPHLYCEMNLDAVVEVVAFLKDESGAYQLPSTNGL